MAWSSLPAKDSRELTDATRNSTENTFFFSTFGHEVTALDAFTVHSSQFTVHSSQFTVHSSQFTVHSSQFTVHSSQFTVHSSQFTVHSSQFTVHSSQFTVHSSQFTVHSSQFTPINTYDSVTDTATLSGTCIHAFGRRYHMFSSTTHPNTVNPSVHGDTPHSHTAPSPTSFPTPPKSQDHQKPPTFIIGSTHATHNTPHSHRTKHDMHYKGHTVQSRSHD